jgi:hypothetical protein
MPWNLILCAGSACITLLLLCLFLTFRGHGLGVASYCLLTVAAGFGGWWALAEYKGSHSRGFLAAHVKPVADLQVSLLSRRVQLDEITPTARSESEYPASFGGGNPSLQPLHITVDELRDVVFAFCINYSKQNAGNENDKFAGNPTKDAFYKRFGNPGQVSEIGDHTYLNYRCKDGMARIRCNTGLFKYYQRLYVTDVAQAG